MSQPRASVLVTGAFGNLGRRVLAELKARGYRVVAMDLDTPANRKGERGAAGSYTQCDLLSAPLAALGVALPVGMLGTGEFYTPWMDTE